MFNPLDILEINQTIQLYFDPSTLNTAQTVCKKWFNVSKDPNFIKLYAPRMEDINQLSHKKLLSCYEYFRPEQLFKLSYKYRLNFEHIVENDLNALNLRICKLKTSLNWYQEHFEQHFPDCVKNWSKNSPGKVEKLQNARNYLYLVALGTSLWFNQNHPSLTLEQITAHTKNTLNNIEDSIQLSFHAQALHYLEQLVHLDCMALDQINPHFTAQLFNSVFSRHSIEQIFYPRPTREIRAFLGFPDPLFEIFFSNLKLPQQIPLKQNSLLKKTWTYLNSFVVSSSKYHYQELCLKVYGNSQLKILLNWLEHSQPKIHTLNLELKAISKEALEQFQEGIKSTLVEKLHICRIEH